MHDDDEMFATVQLAGRSLFQLNCRVAMAGGSLLELAKWLW
jgi:hypothetical protein